MTKNAIATESGIGQYAAQVRHGTTVKSANALYKNAKILYNTGKRKEALTELAKAEKLYSAALEQMRKYGRLKMTKMTAATYDRSRTTSKSVEFKEMLSHEPAVAKVIDYLEDRIDACRARRLMWTNQETKKDLVELKKQLRSERPKTGLFGFFAGNKTEVKATESISKFTLESLLDSDQITEVIEDADADRSVEQPKDVLHQMEEEDDIDDPADPEVDGQVAQEDENKEPHDNLTMDVPDPSQAEESDAEVKDDTDTPEGFDGSSEDIDNTDDSIVPPDGIVTKHETQDNLDAKESYTYCGSTINKKK